MPHRPMHSCGNVEHTPEVTKRELQKERLVSETCKDPRDIGHAGELML